jgi:hypothetical protein
MANTLWQSVLFFKGVCQKLTMQNTIEKFRPYVFAMYVYFLRKLKHEPKKDTMNISVRKRILALPCLSSILVKGEAQDRGLYRN